MEKIARQAFTDAVREEILGRLDALHAVDLGGFENFVFLAGDRVIRITHESHRSADDLLAEIAFLKHLDAGGASVAAPLPVDGDAFVFSTGAFHTTQFERAPGERLPFEPYPHDIIVAWGACIGRFHALARSMPVVSRPDWQADDNHAFALRIPAGQEDVLEQAARTMSRLAELPSTPGVFGLIHSDAHHGNFHVDGNRITVFDFDDCLYAWFGYDLATILFGMVLRPWVADDEPSRIRAMQQFLSPFLEGYSREHDVDSLMMQEMPLLLKLREFSLYGAISFHNDPDLADDPYVLRFMKDRRERLAGDVPFIDYDFRV